MHKNRKPIFGVGINDHPQSVWVNGKVMKEYQIWTDVLRRCYSEFELNRHPTYRGCEASDGFKRFSGFLSWVRDQIGFCESGWQLDKDILFKNNKIYSEDTCCFVPPEINGLFVKNNRNRGLLPIGVKKEPKGYSSTCKVNKKNTIILECLIRLMKLLILTRKPKKTILKKLLISGGRLLIIGCMKL